METCARCGHKLWEHSMGSCDLSGCECGGYCTSGVILIENELATWAVVAWGCAGVMLGLFLGWLVWGAWL